MIEVKKLSLDLKNYRTMPQKTEADAVKAMIAMSPDRFIAVMESIIDNGYLFTENLIVQKEGTKLIVKEGNRRVAILKIILGLYRNIDQFDIPAATRARIDGIDQSWKNANTKVPCYVHGPKEVEQADKIISLTHGKAEKAGRENWNSVARARHNRDINKATELGLDMLEKYLKHGQNLSPSQKNRWGAEYPLTVLEDAIRLTHVHLGCSSQAELVKKYPKLLSQKQVTGLEDLFRDIGLGQAKFAHVRDPKLLLNYNIIDPPPPTPTPKPTPVATPPPTPPSNNNNSSNNSGGKSPAPPTPSVNPGTTPTPTPPSPAYSSRDPKSVQSILKNFAPQGNNRQKVVELRDEILKLNIQKNPLAFCFLLRSMFEISATIYCTQHSISMNRPGGTQKKTLLELLKDVAKHLKTAKPAIEKQLHGAIQDMSQPDRILSVTSMNQLVHNPSFSVITGDVCVVFGNIFPLLEHMN